MSLTMCSLQVQFSGRENGRDGLLHTSRVMVSMLEALGADQQKFQDAFPSLHGEERRGHKEENGTS